MTRLLIIGGGPKAIAIATKAHVLRALGWKVPEVVVLDQMGLAANWDGRNGYTDGATILGTTPLEDVGFPYRSQLDAKIDQEMLQFSYMAHRIDTGDYAEWVNRALTPPTHAMLADYYKWIGKRIGLAVVVGRATTISSDSNEWTVRIEDESGRSQAISSDGLVITGPGNPVAFPRTGSPLEAGRVLNGQNVWEHLNVFHRLEGSKITVIGGGETAAGIVMALVNLVDISTQIEIVTRHPMLFTRNENWMEVMYFSAVMDWEDLAQSEKIEIIRHADRGTFSAIAKNRLDSAYNVRTRLGNVTRIENANGTPRVVYTRREAEEVGYLDCDYVIEATGFDDFSFVSLFEDASLLGDLSSLAQRIEHDLGVAELSPRLHLPALSAMAQGPGFRNLSCLGLLSERILRPYVSH